MSDFNTQSEKIVAFIREKDYKPMRAADMAFLMEIPQEDREIFQEILKQLEIEGKIVFTGKRKIACPEKLNMVIGEFCANNRGFGFVVSENSENDIFIPPNSVLGAMNKDIVLCKISPPTKHKHRSEGTIVKVITRHTTQIVGLFIQRGKSIYVKPDDTKIIYNISINKKFTKGAVNGHKVIVELTKMPTCKEFEEYEFSRNYDYEHSPMPEFQGKVVEILGHKNDPGIDILSVVMQYELPTEFPDQVYEEIEKIPSHVSEEDISPNRKDLRNVTMVTIDGEDAKDLDDAVSINKLENGNYELGVHIADVAHYVKENSPLDKEAYKRGTSVYLINRVIPMLPHKLSNGVCSLNEKVDRLALSCIMEIDKKGMVVSHEICESIIHVDKRMTYTIVSDLLTNDASEHIETYSELIPMFKEMEKLCLILRGKRVKRGAIDFDFAESKIHLDEDGKPVDIKPYPRNIATNIIEEFMLAANETVAEEYYWREIPFVYRAHEEPDDEKLNKLNLFISSFGYSIKGGMTHPKSIQKLLTKIESTPEEMIISRVVLRSFKQASYTSVHSEHFGLAAKYYSHFTSPIRRYPDLQIHRIIKQNLNNTLSEEKIEHYRKTLGEVTKNCSIRERVAESAEREVTSMKKVEYMSDQMNTIFEGIISSVASFGIFVELPNTVSGLISLDSLYDDYYIFDESNHSYVGESTNKVYKLGDKISVKVSRASIDERRLYFSPVNLGNSPW